MSSFFDEQGRTRVCGEAYMRYVAAVLFSSRRRKTHGERRSSKKEPFTDGNYTSLLYFRYFVIALLLEAE
jgi:hypothetical protein